MEGLERLAGPKCLGRSVLLSPGQNAPHPWKECQRVRVDPTSSPKSILHMLNEAWSRRLPMAIELVGELPNPNAVLDRPWWWLSPGLTLPEEVWYHLLTANVVDARDLDRPRFAPRERALEIGASKLTAEQPGDVFVDSVGAVWCDGGPLESFSRESLEGVPVVCAANLAAGSPAPLSFLPVKRSDYSDSSQNGRFDLAADQQAAVEHHGGAACIIAPAGSGKTRVLTERVRYLVNALRVASKTVTLVAYNVRARKEMQDRTAAIDGIQIRTLNSLALAICNGSGRFVKPQHHNPVRVIDEREVRQILNSLIPKRRRRAMVDFLAPWVEALGSSRLGLRDPETVERDYAPDVKGFAEVVPEYAAELARDDLVDFDHQIIRAIGILLTDVQARIAARRVCGVLLVDEFQDLTPAHLLLLRLLAGPRADVFAVGDDDQTIYGYSGASPKWLIEYDRYFSGASRYLLHTNYRCPSEVVEAAKNLLSHNHERVPKRIQPVSVQPASSVHSSAQPNTDAHSREARSAFSAGRLQLGDSSVITAIDGGGEMVAAQTITLLNGGAELSDIAVLTRVNNTLLVPQVYLHRAGIECMAPVKSWFLQRTGVEAVFAWLRLAFAPVDRLPADSLSIAARRPPRGISPRVIEWIAEQHSVARLRALAGRIKDPKTSLKVVAFADDVKRLQILARAGATTVRLLETVFTSGLEKALEGRLDASRRSLSRSTHGDDLRALMGVAVLQPDPSSFEHWLSEQLSAGFDASFSATGATSTYSSFHDSSPPETGFDASGANAVYLATVHKVKGMQWPHVIVFGVSEGLMPHRLSGDTEEERRVFHVAVSRCSESLTIINSGTASPYLTELASQTRNAGEVLRSAQTGKPSDTPSTAAVLKPGDLNPEDKACYERLRQWRLERSRALGIPAYIVFDNKTLVALARQRPTTDAELLEVRGVGPHKLDEYGEDIKKFFS